MKFRTIFVGAALAAVLAALPAQAGPRDDVKAGAARCDSISDDRAWLDCFYGSAQPMRARLGLPPAPASQQALVPAPRPGAPAPVLAPFQVTNTDPSGKPGFFGRLFAHTVVKEEAPSRMTAYSFDQGGFFTVTLANGEVWKQGALDTAKAKWKAQPGSYVVTIVPGPKMKVGAHELYDVERVR